MMPDIDQRELQLTDNEQLLLDWLGNADGTVGECRGPTLDHLVSQGLVEIVGDDPDLDYRTACLTEAGRELLS